MVLFVKLNKKMSKNIVHFCSTIFVLCIFFCFYFSLNSVLSFKASDPAFISEIGRNWMNGPITDVEFIRISNNSLNKEDDKIKNCPPGKDSIIKDEWKGKFLHCENVQNKKLNKYKGKNAKSFECKKASQESRQYKIWKGNNICAKRGLNYLDLKVANSASKCGTNFKSCGIIDTLNNHLCYPLNMPCPYNYIKVLSNNESISPEIPEKNLVVIDFGEHYNNEKLILSNENISGKIIAQFKIQDKTPCLSPDMKNLLINPHFMEHSHGHNTCNKIIGKQKLDYSTNEVDEITYETLYSDNGILENLIKLPGFEKFDYLKSKTKLYSKNYFGFNKECFNQKRNFIDDDTFMDQAKRHDFYRISAEENPQDRKSIEIIKSLINLEDDIKSLINWTLLEFLVSVIAIFCILIFSLILIYSYNIEDMKKKLFIFSIVFISIPQLIVSSLCMMYQSGKNINNEALSKPQCFDTNTGIAVSIYSENVNTGIIYIGLYFASAIIAFISNVGYLYLL